MRGRAVITGTRALVLSAALLLLAVWPAGAQEQPAVLIAGSSSVNGWLGHVLSTELSAAGYRVTTQGRGSSGFARPDHFDWMEHVRVEPGTRWVVLYVGGNDTQALWLRPEERGGGGEWVIWRDEARWDEIYRNRVTAFVDRICDAGARVVVLPLLDPEPSRRPEWRRRLPRVREQQLAGVQGSRCGVALQPLDSWVETDDGVHLTRLGAQHMWERLGGSLLQALGRTGP